MNMIAACGLDCSQCEAYTATQVNDLLMLEHVAEKWSVEFSSPGLTVESIRCDGCMMPGQKMDHCQECKMRLCALERGLTNCAACPEYACAELTAFFQAAPQAKANLDALRQA
jgi:hypothetical protein